MQSEERCNSRGVFKQPIPLLCHGCLSADRELSSIGECINIYRNLCDIKTGLSTDIYFCWECMAMMKRFQTFRKQVNDAQSLLNSMYYDFRKKKSLPESLSRLKATKTNHDCIIFNESELDIKPLEKIKQEMEQDDNFENTDFFDNNEFTYLEDIKSEDPTLIFKLQTIKKETIHHQFTKKRKYCYIRSPKKLIETEQARQTDVSVLWEKDRHTLGGSGSNCEMCLKKFDESESIETHHRKYHDESVGPHICSICNTRYPTPAELASHVASHSTVYRCVVCAHRSLQMEDAVSHASSHVKVVKCRLCKYYCRNVKPDYFSHYKSMHTEFLCDHCGKKCKCKRVLRRHIVRNHTEAKCHICDLVVGSHRYLKNHHALVHETDRSERSFCVKCDVQFQNRARYRRHLTTSPAHAAERNHTKTKELIKCLLCDKRYTRREFMMNHYRYVHTGRSRHHCPQCDKYFLNRTKFVAHRRAVHEGVPQKRDKLCSVCGRGFTTNRILTNHIRTHTGERPFACEQCGARFTQRVARDVHMRRHNRNNAEIK